MKRLIYILQQTIKKVEVVSEEISKADHGNDLLEDLIKQIEVGIPHTIGVTVDDENTGYRITIQKIIE